MADYEILCQSLIQVVYPLTWPLAAYFDSPEAHKIMIVDYGPVLDLLGHYMSFDNTLLVWYCTNCS